MLARQAAWLRASTHDVHFAEYFTSYLDKSSFTKYCCSVLQISHERCYVALTSRQAVAHRSGYSDDSVPFAQLMAFAFVVSREACDEAIHTTPVPPHKECDSYTALKERTEWVASTSSVSPICTSHRDALTDSAAMQTGFATLLCDSLTSVHVMQSLTPACPMHVSVNMLTRMTSPSARSLRPGDKALLVSKIEKLGKRIVYCSARVYVDEDIVSADREAAEREATTVAELEKQLACYYTPVSYSHVKSVMQCA